MSLSLSFAALSIQLDTRPITPIPPNPLPSKAEQKKIALGKKLFNDKTLSPANNRSCASCHNLKTGGTSLTPPGTLNIPTIFNTQYNFKQFWNGSANSSDEAVKLSLLAKDMIGFDPQKDLPKIIRASGYPKNMSFNDMISALTVYISTLNTPGSRFDQYLLGNSAALTDSEKKGYALFQSYGCISCHQGRLVGDNLLQKFGIYNDYFKTKPYQSWNLGYYNVTKNPTDQFVFKVPSLRNVALTAPYLHDGSISDLNKVVESMAFYQLGHPISNDDIKLIVQFLYTLTGEIPKQ